MDALNDLTRRQQIWLLDRQVEGVDHAISETIAATPQPKPSDSQARRMLEKRAGLHPFSLAAVRVATRVMPKDATAAIERAMGYADASLHPLDALPPHETLAHPDLGGLRLWEGENPVDEGTVTTADVRSVLVAAFSLPGRDRLLLSRASGIDQTTLSRMTRGSCKGVTRANLRILAHVLGLSPRVLGLEGPANVDPATARPDLRFAGSFGPKGTISVRTTGTLTGFGGYVMPPRSDDSSKTVLELTDALPAERRNDGGTPTDTDAVRTRRSGPVPSIGHVRIIRSEQAARYASGVSYIVLPEGGSNFAVVGRMTQWRLDAIARILGMPVEGRSAHQGETVVVDILYEGDDEVATRAYRALTSPAAKKTRGWYTGR
jgi:hypothetical protein